MQRFYDLADHLPCDVLKRAVLGCGDRLFVNLITQSGCVVTFANWIGHFVELSIFSKILLVPCLILVTILSKCSEVDSYWVRLSVRMHP